MELGLNGYKYKKNITLKCWKFWNFRKINYWFT